MSHDVIEWSVQAELDRASLGTVMYPERDFGPPGRDGSRPDRFVEGDADALVDGASLSVLIVSVYGFGLVV